DRVSLRHQIPSIRKLLDRLRLGATIETGARFLLDPFRKHQPTLLSKSEKRRGERIVFLFRALEIAAALDIAVVSFWSGAADDDRAPGTMMNLLVDGCLRLCDEADRKRVRLAFEPEPGMFIDTMAKFGELFDRVKHPGFGLTIDIGHLHCQGDVPISKFL